MKEDTKELLQVKEVLKLLNIVRNTLYAWERKGKIKSIRHPMNNYRYYKWSDVKKLIKFIDTAN